MADFGAAYLRLVTALRDRGVPESLLPDDALHVKRGSRGGPYCAAGSSMLWLTPSGTFSPCGLLPGTLGALEVLGSLPHPGVRALADMPVRCRGCPILRACGGGCPALRPCLLCDTLLAMGDLFAP